MSSFAKSLRRIRKAAGMTQDDLAQKVSVTRQAVSAWERGRTEPDIQTLATLAEALNVDANELLFGRKPEQRPAVRKKDLMTTALSFGITLLVLILQLTLYPYLIKLQKEQYLSYAFPYGQIVPPIGYFAGGVFLLSLTALFFPIKTGRKQRVICLLSGIILAAPSVFVILETVLWLFMPHIPMPFSSFITRSIIRNPALKIVLFQLCPFLSGVFLLLRKKRKSGGQSGTEDPSSTFQ